MKRLAKQQPKRKLKTLRVFLASPGDLAPERRAFVSELQKLNRSWGKDRAITFEPLVWEESATPAGPRTQGLLNKMIDRCDVFVLALFRHWGQAAPDSSFDSYTEEEFHRAIARLTAQRRSAVRVFVFLKDIPRSVLASPDAQLEKVLAFRAELERTRTVLARPFSDVRGFRQLLRKHVCGSADPGQAGDVIVERLPLRLELVERVNRARANAQRRARARDKGPSCGSLAGASATMRSAGGEVAGELRVLTLARQAAKAAGEGRLEEARQKFARVTADAVNGEALFLAYDFYRNVNDAQAMEDVLKMALAYYGPDTICIDTASALAQLGNLYLDRGNLSQAERLQRKSLDMNRQLGSEKGIADQLTRMGIVLAEKGDWTEAQEMFAQSVRINRRIERPLGLRFAYFQSAVARFREGDFEDAAKQVRKAQRIDRKQAWDLRLARDYRLLGDIQLEMAAEQSAVRCYRKALKLFRKVHHAGEAIACQKAVDDLT